MRQAVQIHLQPSVGKKLQSFESAGHHCSIITGDILIFMPGQEEIEVTCDVIKGTACFALCVVLCTLIKVHIL